MTGKDMIKEANDNAKGWGFEAEPCESFNTLAHTILLELHARALACHCECLGMNAENMWAAIANARPVYLQKDYLAMMKKWDLINDKGDPTI